ncbi:MAG: carbohydrate kinase family protein [Patescibacteria group bacterium]
MFDVITIGGALRDFTFYIKEGKLSEGQFIFPLDSKIQVQKAYFTNGGGANNVAVGLARFGLKVALISRIGQDFSGQAILKNLKKNKIETKFVQIDPKLHTGVSVIVQKRGQGKVLFTFRGANEKLEIRNLRLGISKWVYVAALTGNWENILNRIFQPSNTKHSAFKIAWNPGAVQLAAGKKKLAKYLKRTGVLILNRHEAAQLLNQKPLKQLGGVKFKDQIRNFLQEIHRLGPRIVAITCGRRGAFVYEGQKIYYRLTNGSKPKDATGAGDAFSSGFLAGLILFNDIKKALKLGISNSGSVIRVVGAQEGLLDKKILKNL